MLCVPCYSSLSIEECHSILPCERTSTSLTEPDMRISTHPALRQTSRDERQCIQMVNDAEAKCQEMSDEQRLQFHQRQSGPKMDEIKAWLTEQIEQHKGEHNSKLGKAVTRPGSAGICLT